MCYNTHFYSCLLSGPLTDLYKTDGEMLVLSPCGMLSSHPIHCIALRYCIKLAYYDTTGMNRIEIACLFFYARIGKTCPPWGQGYTFWPPPPPPEIFDAQSVLAGMPGDAPVC